MTDTFTWAPEQGATKNAKSRIKIAQFGEGYMQREYDGINPVSDEWSLSFNNRERTEIDAIETFVRQHSVAYFLWTPPYETVAKKFIVDSNSYSRSVVNASLASLQVTFKEVFDL